MAAAVNCPKHYKNRSNNGNVFSAFLFLFSKIRQFRVQPYHTSPPKKLEEILTALLAYNKLPLKIKEMTTKKIIAESSWFFCRFRYLC